MAWMDKEMAMAFGGTTACQVTPEIQQQLPTAT
jgi:hypothetical protein